MHHFLEKFFYEWGLFVGKHPTPFLIGPILLTLVSSLGLLNFQIKSDTWDMYTPADALSRIARDDLHDLFPEQFNKDCDNELYIMVSKWNKANKTGLLASHTLEYILDIDYYVQYNMSINVDHQTFTYLDLVKQGCNVADQNRKVLKMLRLFTKEQGKNPNFVMNYPLATILKKEFFLGQILGEIEYDRRQRVQNSSLIILRYALRKSNRLDEKLSAAFEKALVGFLSSYKKVGRRAGLQLSLLSQNVDKEEQMKVTLTTLPYLAGTVFILISFCVSTLYNSDVKKSQHVEALFALISPTMACATGFGCLWTLGVPFNNVLTIVPFLILVIGVDDAFLILGAWRQAYDKHDPTNKVDQRLALALSTSGTSITVTSLTDILCFGLGYIADMEAVRLFCLCASVSITIDFLYQITFFSAVIVLRGRRIDRKIQPSCVKKQIPYMDRFGCNKLFSCPNSNNKVQPETVTKVNKSTSKVILMHRICHNKFIRVFIFATTFVHWLVTLYFATKLEYDFRGSKLYLSTSPTVAISSRFEDYIFKSAMTVIFVMREVPDFENEEIRLDFLNLIEDLENIPKYGRSISESGISYCRLWLKDYETMGQNFAAINFFNYTSKFDSSVLLENFETMDMDTRWFRTELNETTGRRYIKAFFWTITYRNLDNEYNSVRELLQYRRQILKNYEGRLPLTTSFHNYDITTEALWQVPKNLMQTTGIALILMAFLVHIFVQNTAATFWVSLTLFSIVNGTIGWLNVWGVSIDGISLIAILMCVGVSVDYTAHVCYHFFTNNIRDIDHVESTVLSVGWPVLQAILSTILGMLPLSLINSYVVSVFYKTVVIVNILGCFHAMVLLPSVFITFHCQNGQMQKIKKRKRIEP